MADPQRITLKLADGKPAATFATGTLVNPGEVVIEVDADDIQGDQQNTITKIAELVREVLYNS